MKHIYAIVMPILFVVHIPCVAQSDYAHTETNRPEKEFPGISVYIGLLQKVGGQT